MKRETVVWTEFQRNVDSLKLTIIFGQYMSDEYRNHYYAKAKNLCRKLYTHYDEALADVDVLAMPTTPQTAYEAVPDLGRLEAMDRALNMFSNTAPFDLTGHPAVSVPVGESDGLPVGLMLVGNQFDDRTVLQAAYAFEQTVGWDLS